MAFDPYIHYKYNFKVEEDPPSSKDGPDLSNNRSKDAAFYFNYPLTFNQGEGVDKYTSPERSNCQVYCRSGYIASGFFFPDAGSHCGGDWDTLEDQFLPKQSWFSSKKSTIQVDGHVYVLPGGDESVRKKITAVTHPHFFATPINPVASGAIAKNNRWVMADKELSYKTIGQNAAINNRYKLRHHFSTFGMKFWCSGEDWAKDGVTKVHSKKCPDGFGRPGPPPKSKTKNFSYDWEGGEACLSCIEPESSDPLGRTPVKDTECLEVRFSGDGLIKVHPDYETLRLTMTKVELRDSMALHGSGVDPSDKLDMVLGEQRRLTFGTNELRIDTNNLKNSNTRIATNIGDYPWDEVGMGQSFLDDKYRPGEMSPDAVAGRKSADSLSHFEVINSGEHFYTGALGRYDGQAEVTIRAVMELSAHQNRCNTCPVELGCDTLDEEKIWFSMIDDCKTDQGYKAKMSSIVNRGLISVPEKLKLATMADRYHKAGSTSSSDQYINIGGDAVTGGDAADYDWNINKEPDQDDYRIIHNAHPIITWDKVVPGGSKVHIYVFSRTKKSETVYKRDLNDYGARWKCRPGDKPQMARWTQPSLIYAGTVLGKGGTPDPDPRWADGMGGLIGKVGTHEGVEFANLSPPCKDDTGKGTTCEPGQANTIHTGVRWRYKVQVIVENGNGIRSQLSDAVYFSIVIPNGGEGVWWR